MKYRCIRHTVLPVGLLPAPGGFNMRLDPGEVFETTTVAAVRHGRYLNNRIALGDLEEIADEPSGRKDKK